MTSLHVSDGLRNQISKGFQMIETCSALQHVPEFSHVFGVREDAFLGNVLWIDELNMKTTSPNQYMSLLQ